MERTRGFAVFVAGVGALVALPALPATAVDPPSVTLAADPAIVEFTETTELSGGITPASEGETVFIVDEATGETLADTVTASDGSFAVTYQPGASLTVHALWMAATSDPVNIGVRPEVSASLGRVLLFARAVAAGRLRPPHPGSSVEVSLLRGRRVVFRRSVATDDDGRFRTRFPIRTPGRYRAVAAFSGDLDHLPARDSTGRRSTRLPNLASGSNGVYVLLLERRLRDLAYHLEGVDRSYDYRTADAVMAFNKVQGRFRVGTVDASTWHALAGPIRPGAVSRVPGFHVEVDQTRQVLYTVRDGKVTSISHVSTGAGGATNDGVFHVWSKNPGYSPKGLYKPSFFDGERAVHGWPEVPNYNASHGCVRVPNWVAPWIYDLMPIGTEVRIYHS